MTKAVRTISLAAATAILAISLFALPGCKNKNPITYDVDENEIDFTNISAEPDYTTSPTDYSGKKDNVAFMVYVLGEQKYWHVDESTIAETSIFNTQNTYTFKDYCDGVMIAEEKSKGTFVGSSMQVYFDLNPDARGAYIREGSKPDDEEQYLDDITWTDDAPEYYTEDGYNGLYGLFMNEICLYCLCDSAIVECGDVTDNGDGTYEQTFLLNASYASHYYQYSIYTHGGFGYPKYNDDDTVELTFTFNGSWEVLKIHGTDSYKVMGFGTDCELNMQFSYGEESINTEVYNEGLSYFEPYLGKLSPVE